MAENIINKKIEFAYATENLNELIAELEKRFLYQKIIVVDNKYELVDEINLLIKKVKCDLTVVKNLIDVQDLDNYACIIDINCYDINNIKTICTKQGIPYILVNTKIFEISFLNCEIVDANKKLKKLNYPLGVILNKSKIDKQDFICKFLLEVSNFMFDNMQAKIDNLFFNNSSSVFFEEHIFEKLSQQINVQKNNQEVFDNLAKYYLAICIKKASKPLSLLDRTTDLCFCYKNSIKNKIQTRFLLQCLISSITKSFLLYFTKKIKSTLNLEKYKKFLDKYSLDCDIKSIILPEQKINYLLNEFRGKLVKYADDHLQTNKVIKSMIADISVDFLYQTFNIKFDNQLTDFICLEPNLFNKNSILTLLSINGLLNFDF